MPPPPTALQAPLHRRYDDASGAGGGVGGERLDLLARVPVPLRRLFKLGLDRALAQHRAVGGPALRCTCLDGAEWRHPFDALLQAGDPPAMLVSPLAADILGATLRAHYLPVPRTAAHERLRNERAALMHPACRSLQDPQGIFHCTAVVPFVFLVDHTRLRGRPAPRVWDDLLQPHWRADISFGGWRPMDDGPYPEYNAWLLFCLQHFWGEAGLSAFAAHVRHLQHNVRSALISGSNHEDAVAVTVLPWMQARLCPRRDRTEVIWPQDGALALPIGYMVRPAAHARVTVLRDYLEGEDLATELAHNDYPPTLARQHDPFPSSARLRWPGWDTLLQGDLAGRMQSAARCFFAAHHGQELSPCV